MTTSPSSNVFFNTETQSAIDFIDPKTDRGRYSGKSAAELSAENPPGCIVVMPWEQARQAQRQKHITPATAITPEYFDEMLNILPPEGWVRGAGFEHFFLCERISDDVVMYCVRTGGDYWKFQDVAHLSTADVLRRIDAARTTRT